MPVTDDSPDPSWEILFCETAGGHRPAEAWLREQSPKVQARFARIFDLLEEHGTAVREPYVAHLRGKIWEVRVEQDKIQHRLLYFATPQRKFVVVHGFVKTQKTPPKEISVAEHRMRDYITRLGRE
jgi:phage-related protein